LTTNSLNAKDIPVRQVAEDVFEDLGGLECSLPRRIGDHGTSSPARCGGIVDCRESLELLGELLALNIAYKIEWRRLALLDGSLSGAARFLGTMALLWLM
jgi:hypothetical protein